MSLDNQPPQYEAYEVTSLFARYSGAWQEYNQRITARHTIINLWVLSTGSLFVFFVDRAYPRGGECPQVFLLKMVVLTFALLTVAMFVLMVVHDLVMQKLSDYMYVCESHNNQSEDYFRGAKILPSYRVDGKDYAKGFLWIRSFQNITLVGLCYGTLVGIRFIEANIKIIIFDIYEPESFLILILMAIAIFLNLYSLMYRKYRSDARKTETEANDNVTQFKEIREWFKEKGTEKRWSNLFYWGSFFCIAFELLCFSWIALPRLLV